MPLSQPSALLVWLLGSAMFLSTSSGLRGQELPWQLRILPSVIHANQGYPASFIVAQSRSDDSLLTLDVSQGCEISIDDPSIAMLDHGKVVAVQVGQTQLRVRAAGEETTASIVVDRAGAQEVAFDREVESSLTRLGCNSGTCHGSLHGKGGFRLSLRGQDPALDFQSIAIDLNGRRIDLFEPKQSLVLAKPSGKLAHAGGLKLRGDSVHYEALLKWLKEGALPPKSESTRTLKALELSPARGWISSGHSEQPLIAIATWSDGTADDVTPWVRLECSSIQGATVNEQGMVRCTQPIDTTISAFYLGAHASSRLVFLPKRESNDDATVRHSAQVPQNPIDVHIARRLDRLGIDPKQEAAPEILLRRMYLQTIGRLPTLEEQDAFLNADTTTRVDALIDRLLADDQYAAMWAMRWSDLLRNEPKVMSERGVAGLHAWLVRAVANDQPVDQMVSQLIATIGSTYEHPEASFHRTHRDPTVAAEAIGQTFLGVRMQCAKCHNHPFDVWTQDDYYGLAAFFATIERKQIDNQPKDKLDTHVITGDEIISLADKRAALMHPGRSKLIAAKRIGDAVVVVDNPNEPVTNATSPLESLANWITRDNRQFARNMANRVWSQAMGRGIVDPPDDFRGSNPPSNPELLEYLTDAWIEHGYSTRWLMREILRSQAFAREGIARDDADPQNEAAIANFAGFPVRRMPAEILQDAIADLTGTTLQFKSQSQAANEESNEPIRARAVAYPSISRRNVFLKAFGKPDRLIDCECERSSDLSLRQSLLLVNDRSVRDQLKDDEGSVARWASSDDPKQGVLRLYRTAFCREPSAREWAAIEPMFRDDSLRRRALEDIAWAIINSKEFLFIR